MPKKYSLRYLPLFEQDLAEARDYIANILHNPVAAQRLIDDTDKEIINRLGNNPSAFEPHHSAKDRKHPYYPIRIKNYTVFYVLIDNVMEIRRFVYSKRDISKLL